MTSIRGRFLYTKHGLLSWDKWSPVDGEIFAKDSVHYLTIRSKKDSNEDDRNGKNPRKIIVISDITVVRYILNDKTKDEPSSILEIKSRGKKYRLGFDNDTDCHQWRSHLEVLSFQHITNKSDGAYESSMGIVLYACSRIKYRCLYYSINRTEWMLELSPKAYIQGKLRFELCSDLEALALYTKFKGNLETLERQRFYQPSVRTSQTVSSTTNSLPSYGEKVRVGRSTRTSVREPPSTNGTNYSQSHTDLRSYDTKAALKHPRRQTQRDHISHRAHTQSSFAVP
ncbi:unnamed protein product, partial [Didymodactylos carnosus]